MRSCLTPICCGDDLPPFETLVAVLHPRVRAVRAVLAQLHPLVAELAEHTARFNLAQVWVRTQGGGTLVGTTSAGFLHA